MADQYKVKGPVPVRGVEPGEILTEELTPEVRDRLIRRGSLEVVGEASSETETANEETTQSSDENVTEEGASGWPSTS